MNITIHRKISKIKYCGEFSSMEVSGLQLRAGCLRLYDGRLVLKARYLDSI